MAFCSCSCGLIDWCACADDLCEGDAKNAHLMSLDSTAERLRLFKADLLDYGSVAAAIAGCDDVFHVACPVHTLAAAVTGTTNVRKACSEARLGLGRVVVVSYVSAAMVIVCLIICSTEELAHAEWALSPKSGARKNEKGALADSNKGLLPPPLLSVPCENFSHETSEQTVATIVFQSWR
uniref:3-beta hydroxysteroid dehydrogenase/isomerase domain-containing protein n=1 Tax=Oryza glumipatula TaxID=40148 RepID=A0A0E0ADS0_9ORYZ